MVFIGLLSIDSGSMIFLHLIMGTMRIFLMISRLSNLILVLWVESFFKRHRKTMNVWLNGDKWLMVVIIKMFGLLMILLFEKSNRWKNRHVQSKDKTSVEMIDDDVLLGIFWCRSFQSKLTYIRPGFVLSFQVDVVNVKDAKALLDFNDVCHFSYSYRVISRLSNLVSSSHQFNPMGSESTIGFIRLSIRKLVKDHHRSFTQIDLVYVCHRQFNCSCNEKIWLDQYPFGCTMWKWLLVEWALSRRSLSVRKINLYTFLMLASVYLLKFINKSINRRMGKYGIEWSWDSKD